MAKKEDPIIRTAPHSKESEMMVLGCMITSVNSLNIAADMLDESDFYFTEHQIIFQVLKRAYKSERPADLHLVAEELKRSEKLDAIGGMNYLTTLAQYAGTSAYIEEYTQLIRNKAILRRMIRASQDIEKAALEDPKEPSEVLDQAQAKFFEISQDSHKDDSVLVKDLISGLKAEKGIPYLKELQERQEYYQQTGSSMGVVGMPSHFDDLDKMLGGFAPSNLMIIAGRPGMGKTAIALNFAENICFKNDVSVGVFSLEMSAEQLLHRIICSQSEVDSDKIRNGSLDGSEYQRVVSCVNAMQEKNFIIDDQPGLKVTDLRSRARRMKELYDIQFLVIDYLQLLSGSGTARGNESRQIEISEISRMLKNLARELNIPILCGSQLSRKVEERQGHRPMMSDLRESGSLEQDSDVVMFLLRKEYYDPYDKPGQAELIVAKNRHGGTGSITLAFRKEIGQFANFTSHLDETSTNDDAFSSFSPN